MLITLLRGYECRLVTVELFARSLYAVRFGQISPRAQDFRLAELSTVTRRHP